MSFFDNLKKAAKIAAAGAAVGAAKTAEAAYASHGLAKEAMGQSIIEASLKDRSVLGGKSLSEWERWEYIGKLDGADLKPLGKYVGVYKAELDGRVVYIGRAIEHLNGGFRKRLSDYTRESDSSRKHGSGQQMHANAKTLDISVIKTGSDAEAAQVAARLEAALIAKYKPRWNKQLKGL